MADLLIGLTGGVASGKSAATECFEALGVPVIDADIAARDAVAVGSDGLAAVIAAFGIDALDASGALDRAAMRRRVFADDDARRRLEAIVHPQVRAMLHSRCQAAIGAYAIAAIPLLTEGGRQTAYPWLQRVLLIDVPAALQHARLLARDGIDAALAERMIAAQASRAERLAIADDIIVNDRSLEALQAHVTALHRRYLQLRSSAPWAR
ncbi:MAG: dephospho-CoA kinase [Luteimonas sp.]